MNLVHKNEAGEWDFGTARAGVADPKQRMGRNQELSRGKTEISM
jgi:hypothetical protein